MQKKVLQFGKFADEIISIDGQDVIVAPFLTLDQMVSLINQYVENYFYPEVKSINKSERAYYDAEQALKLGIVDLATSIQIEGSEFEHLFYDPEIFNKITACINNYWEFDELLRGTVDSIKEEMELKNSIGAKMDELFNKISLLLDNLQESMANLNPEMLEKLKATGNELVEKISNNELVQGVFADADKK